MICIGEINYGKETKKKSTRKTIERRKQRNTAEMGVQQSKQRLNAMRAHELIHQMLVDERCMQEAVDLLAPIKSGDEFCARFNGLRTAQNTETDRQAKHDTDDRKQFPLTSMVIQSCGLRSGSNAALRRAAERMS